MVSGTIYSGLMAGSNYHDGNQFDVTKTLLHFVLFGLFMGALTIFNKNKEDKK